MSISTEKHLIISDDRIKTAFFLGILLAKINLKYAWNILLFILLFVFSTAIHAYATDFQIGDTAPGIFLKDLNNNVFFLSDYCGTPRQPWKKFERNTVVISFFSTYCVPCLKEIPELQQIAKKYPDTKFFLVNLKEEKSKIEPYVSKYNITLPILLDKYGVIAKKYGVDALPKLFVINKKGKIIYIQNGYDKNMVKKLNHLFDGQ